MHVVLPLKCTHIFNLIILLKLMNMIGALIWHPSFLHLKTTAKAVLTLGYCLWDSLCVKFIDFPSEYTVILEVLE